MRPLLKQVIEAILAMSDALQKFPSTPHLAWLAKTPVRDDKLLSPSDAQRFLRGDLVIEEKVDGANLGISFNAIGKLRLQNRGNWLEGKLSGQWQRLRGWASEHETTLRRLLPRNHLLFGEWCYAVHSIRYDRLPDWFLAFDVYDSELQRFWSTRRRDPLLRAAGIENVPQIARGRFTLNDLRQMLKGLSTFGRSVREGLYMRVENDNWLLSRAKLVNPVFTQAIAQHWSQKPIEVNAIIRSKAGQKS
jgi:hypothetical protein